MVPEVSLVASVELSIATKYKLVLLFIQGRLWLTLALSRLQFVVKLGWSHVKIQLRLWLLSFLRAARYVFVRSRFYARLGRHNVVFFQEMAQAVIERRLSLPKGLRVFWQGVCTDDSHVSKFLERNFVYDSELLMRSVAHVEHYLEGRVGGRGGAWPP